MEKRNAYENDVQRKRLLCFEIDGICENFCLVVMASVGGSPLVDVVNCVSPIFQSIAFL